MKGDAQLKKDVLAEVAFRSGDRPTEAREDPRLDRTTCHDTSLTSTSALSACNAWFDLNSRCIEQWTEWQRALWQPTLDLQIRWFDDCLRRFGGPMTQRGGEQLA